MSPSEIRAEFKDMLYCIHIEKSTLNSHKNIYELLKEAGIRPSISKLDKLSKLGGLRINGVKVDPSKLALVDYPPIANCLYIIKSGKKEYHSLFLK